MTYEPMHDPVDDLARAIPGYRPTAARVEQVRTAILAGSPSVTQARAPMRRGAYAAAAAIALAAAAVLAWTLRPTGDATVAVGVDHHGTVVAIGAADFDRGSVPDEIVRVRDGRVRVTVTPPAAGERFRIVTGDAEVELRGGAVELEVRGDHLQWVVAGSREVAVRPSYGEEVLLDDDDRWDAPKMAVAEPAPVTKPAPRTTPKVQRAAPSTPARPAVVAAPGEAEFRAGWAALKAGDPSGAADSFAAARQAKGSAVTEDASFWEGIALARAGKAAKATAALRRFLSTYPSSSRAGEAAAKLGWLLYDAGDRDAAERYFRSASDDAVPKVQKSARDGLTAVERQRSAQ